MKCSRMSTLLLATITSMAARAGERLPIIPPAQYTQEQKQAAADFEAARKVPVFGPFEPLLYSPQVMSTARAMGDYLRYKSAIGNTLSELVILMTAHEWRQEYEWSLHYPIAMKAGIRKELADAIAVGRRPTIMSPDEEAVFDFTGELLGTRSSLRCDFCACQVAPGREGSRRHDRNHRLLHVSCDAAQCRSVPDCYGPKANSAGTSVAKRSGVSRCCA